MPCPLCRAMVEETAGSPVSPAINVYRCPACQWTALRCGNTACSGYLAPQEMGYANTVRYNCVTCDWTGTGSRFVRSPRPTLTSAAGGAVGAFLVGLGIVAGLGLAGVAALRNSVAQGEAPILAFALLALPLLITGVAAAGGVFAVVPPLKHGHETAKGGLALVVAAVLGVGVYGLNSDIPVQRPDPAVTTGVGVACAGQPVPLAGDVHSDGAEINHLVVLDAQGAEFDWTGKAVLEWRPPSVADVEFVACVEKEQTSVAQTCRYTGGSVTKLHSATREVRVVAARSGTDAARFVIANRPTQADCPFSKVGGDDDDEWSPVSWEQVAAHLESLVDEGRFVDPDGVSTLEGPTGAGSAQGSPVPALVTPEPTAPPPTAPPAVELRQAVEAGSVAVSGRGMNLEQLEITLKSKADLTMRVVINPGNVLNPGSSSTQSMVVITKEVVTLEPGAEVSLELEVACADMKRNTPDGSDVFRLDADPPLSALVKLFKVEAFADLEFRIKQFAVWTITDNPSRTGYVGLGYFGAGSGPSKEELGQIRDLFIEAGLDPDAYRAL